MNSSDGVSRSNLLVNVAAFVVIVAGMKAAASLLVPFLVAIFLAVLAGPLVFWLKGKGVPSSLSVLVVVIILIGFLGLIGALVGTSMNSFIAAVPGYQSDLKEDLALLANWLSENGVEHVDMSLLSYLDLGGAMNVAASVLTSVGGVLTNAFLIFLTVIFILLEASGFPAKLAAALPNSDVTLGQFSEFAQRLKQYVAIKSATSLLTGASVTVLLSILDIDFAILWGLLAFLLNFIPTLGSIFAAVPAVLLGLIQHGIGGAVLVAVGYLVINFVVASLLEPRFLGRGLGISTLVVFLSLVAWAWVLGPVGAILSVPLTITLKIALQGNKKTRRIALLLGPEAVFDLDETNSEDDGLERAGDQS